LPQTQPGAKGRAKGRQHCSKSDEEEDGEPGMSVCVRGLLLT
jgi:hypothetical protein